MGLHPFRNRERKLYEVSDFIGCMSPANCKYLCEHNSEINPEIIEVNPNSIEPVGISITIAEKAFIRQKYKIPDGATVLIYGGNLGKPQGVPFLLETIENLENETGIYFIIVGSGTEFSRLEEWFKLHRPANANLLSSLPKKEYDLLLQSSDIGLIFLDRSFTIPNFPARLLPYLDYKIPVIAATDINTDLGTIIEENKFGLWSESGDIKSIRRKILLLAKSSNIRKEMGENGNRYLHSNHTVSLSYATVMRHLQVHSD